MGTLGHVVIQPSASPHRTLRLVTDVDLLLAATIASVRMNRQTVVFEPPASLAACERCEEAYAEARRKVENQGQVVLSLPDTPLLHRGVDSDGLPPALKRRPTVLAILAIRCHDPMSSKDEQIRK
jgi:hypothetical protein